MRDVCACGAQGTNGMLVVAGGFNYLLPDGQQFFNDTWIMASNMQWTLVSGPGAGTWAPRWVA